MAYVCNPSYLGDGDQKVSNSLSAWTGQEAGEKVGEMALTMHAHMNKWIKKKRPAWRVSETPSQIIKMLGVVLQACHHCYVRSINRKTMVQAGQGINAKRYLKNNKGKKDWQCGSNVRGPTWEVQGSEFKSQYHINNQL
jgi:hypothetical protein